MKTAACIVISVLLCLSINPVFGRTIGSDTYHTEEELYEGYVNGDIDYQTYLNLLEILNSGVDSTSLYLLEEIPNIDFISSESLEKKSDIEDEQTRIYLSETQPKEDKIFSGSVKFNIYQKLDTLGQDQERIYIKSRLSENWTINLNAVDEYIGKQKFTSRSLIYRNQYSKIERLVIGNYTAKFGLGLTVGYRGRLVSKDYLSAAESFLFSEYGGFNGLYAEGGSRKNKVKWLFHFDQNDTIQVKATAINVVSKFGDYGRYRVEGSLLGSVINNRISDDEFRQLQMGLLLSHRGANLEAALEGTLPINNLEDRGNDNSAALAKVIYNQYDYNIKFSAWYYGKDFVNLFGGGRSGDLYRTISVDTVDLKYRDRRNNQRGFVLRSLLSLSETFESDLSFSIYGSSRFERNIEMQSSLGKIIAENSRLRLYYELYRKERPGDISTNNRYKLEYFYRVPRFSIRSYVGYLYNKKNEKYLSFLFRGRLVNKFLKEIEFWVNFSRINIETNNIDYFYTYIMEKVDLSQNASLAVKYRYRYNRSYNQPHDYTLFLETFITW